METDYKKGFTLIELLVVVAIIGILASVVLASLNSARAKGADAKIKAQLANMRGQAMLYSNSTASGFSGACAISSGTLFETTNNGLGGLLNGIITSTATDAYCISAGGLPETGAAWAVAAKISTGVWCVDSTGVSRDTIGYTATKYTVPASSAINADSSSATYRSCL